ETGALGVFHHAAFERDGAQLVGLSAARPHAGLLLGISSKLLGARAATDKRAKGSGCASRVNQWTNPLVSTKVVEPARRARQRLGPQRADACLDLWVIDGGMGKAVRLELCSRNGPFCSRLNGAIIVPRRPDRRDAGEPRPAQRALARYFPTDRRELPRHRRTRGLAQYFTLDHDPAVACVRAQRDVGSGAARPHLCAAHLGWAAADRARLAFLRRCIDGDRRPRGIR